ncbi:MAG: hypothetical protein HY509_02235 [Acidobacteria bacterium]|nr:hypothetical protein [Acidobacteriota bacterium]
MSGFERWLLHLGTVWLGASGLGFAIMKYLLEPIDPYAMVNHPLQPWALAVHVLAAPITLFAVGIILKEHVWAEFRRQVPRHRPSGALALAALAACALSGYLLQTTTREGLRLLLVWVHLSAGGLFLAGYLAHFVLGRRRRLERRRRREFLVSGPAHRYNSEEPGSEGEPASSVEGLA